MPAIFLYRQTSLSGDTFVYNILDGKQRLESLMLFVGNLRPALAVKDIRRYFYEPAVRNQANFKVELEFEGEKNRALSLKDLPNDLFRNLKEYIIPTIEITLNEDEPNAIGEII